MCVCVCVFMSARVCECVCIVCVCVCVSFWYPFRGWLFALHVYVCLFCAIE